MQQRHSVGGSGVEISRIGLGGYGLGPEPDEQRDPERAAGVIRTALDCGVNWLDTSENYLATHNEALDSPVAQVAIAWVLHQPDVTAAIAGSRSEAHTRDNAGASRLAFSSEMLDQIDELVPLGPTQAAPA